MRHCGVGMICILLGDRLWRKRASEGMGWVEVEPEEVGASFKRLGDRIGMDHSKKTLVSMDISRM